MNRFISLYSLRYPDALVYMLQSTEYDTKQFMDWYWRVSDFRRVMYRRSLEKTKATVLLLGVISCGMIIQILVGIICVYVGQAHNTIGLTLLGAFLVLVYPVSGAYLIVLAVMLGRISIINPRDRKRVAMSREIFKNHPGITIAVAGSYGKTSMKELLTTVLGEGLHVAATPANKNVATSHAKFALTLTGEEDVLVIEYGEGKPGDIRQFAEVTYPNRAIITGLAPAHMDHYPSLEVAGKDIFSVTDYVDNGYVYVNGESEAAHDFTESTYKTYDSHQVLGWKILDIKIDFRGTSFTMTKHNQRLKLKSGLLGRHQVGPLALVAALGLELGLSTQQVEKGIKQTQPFEHRMQPRKLSGAWILDDTYNGNIEGMKAGLRLLKELPGNRKIYVTPGLVNQGQEERTVHLELGQAIAESRPERVVLMSNSVTSIIREGLAVGKYEGEIMVESDPLEFYTNLEHFIAAGDLVLMQNDWTDNYN